MEGLIQKRWPKQEEEGLKREEGRREEGFVKVQPEVKDL